jgi:hypothetical protein
LRKGLLGGYDQQRFGSSYHVYAFTAGLDDAPQFTFFLLAQGTQGIFLGLSH